MKESFNFIGANCYPVVGVENNPSDLNLEIRDMRANTGVELMQ